VTASINDSWQTVGWNTLTLSCPARWETIITGTTHLLFEENFQPVLELRWEKEKKQSKHSIEATLHKIAEETGLPVQESLPPHWKKLKERYAIKLLADNATKECKAAILICKECGTTLLLYFFHDLATKHHWDLINVLSSISCHEQNNREKTLWAIQDFQILLPKSFKLSGHNFGAGLTRLSFIDSGGLTMHLCRLAGASQRLQTSSMLTLLNLLGDLNIPEEDAQHLESSVSHCSYPSIFQQIRSRIKREQPFHWVILRHHPEYDRLSGLFFFDKRPIPDKTISTILDSYEFFSL
jgi:hypothetical protein